MSWKYKKNSLIGVKFASITSPEYLHKICLRHPLTKPSTDHRKRPLCPCMFSKFSKLRHSWRTPTIDRTACDGLLMGTRHVKKTINPTRLRNIKILKRFNFLQIHWNRLFPSFPPFSPSSTPQSLFCSLIFWFPSFTSTPKVFSHSLTIRVLVLCRCSSLFRVKFLIHWLHYQECASTLSLIYISFLFFHAKIHVSKFKGVWYLTSNECYDLIPTILCAFRQLLL